MIALPILAGLLAGILANLYADSLSAYRSSDARPVRFLLGAPTCTHCGRQRPLLAWSGLVASLTGRRRCASCTTALPWRHTFVELALIALYSLIWTSFGAQAPTEPALTKVLNCLYGTILVLILVTDMEHRLVPHAIMLPAIVLAALAAFVNPLWTSPTRALLGGSLGLLGGLTLYGGGILFVRLLGRLRGQPVAETAFGFGDVTLLTFLGLIVGAPEILFALLIGVLCGGIFSLVLIIVSGLVRKQNTLLTAIPYAPFLILGGAIMLAFGREVMAWYLRGV